MPYKVAIHLYDLSQGMAKQLSLSLIGKQIEGIWHTGLVVYGKEYYFGGGICCDPPGQTPYGFPKQKLDAGETDIPEEVFLDFLKDVGGKFTIDKYDLFENNCNNFTDTCCEFLTGQGIPSFITGLPKDVLETPFGQMIKPLVDGFTQALNQNSHPLPQMFEGQNNQSALNLTHQPLNKPSTSTNVVQEVTSIEQFFEVLDSNPAVIVDFFSLTCPPCMRIKPIYEKLAQDYEKKGSKLKFISVNVSTSREIVMNYEINAFPTFIGFYDGLQFEKFLGADPAKLQSLAAKLESKISTGSANNIQATTTKNTVHENSQNLPKLFDPTKKNFMRFEGDAYALPINSIRSVLDKYPTLNQSESKAIFVAFSKDPNTNAKALSDEDKTNLVNWILESVAFIGIGDKVIGFLDLLKMLCLDQSYAAAVTKNSEKLDGIIKFLDKSEQSLKEIQKGLRLVLLRLLTNITANETNTDYFQTRLVSFIKQIWIAAKAFKDEKPALHAIFMILWNLTQNYAVTQDFGEIRDMIIELALETFNGSQDNDIALLCLWILCWISFNFKGLRAILTEKVNEGKLQKMESSSDPKIEKASKALSSIIAGKTL